MATKRLESVVLASDIMELADPEDMPTYIELEAVFNPGADDFHSRYIGLITSESDLNLPDSVDVMNTLVIELRPHDAEALAAKLLRFVQVLADHKKS